MKKQLLALAGAAALGVGAIAGNTAPSVNVDPTARAGYVIAGYMGGGPYIEVPLTGSGSAAGGMIGRRVGNWVGEKVGGYVARPVAAAAGTAARAAFARSGMLMGARFGMAIGALGGPVGAIVGVGIGGL